MKKTAFGCGLWLPFIIAVMSTQVSAQTAVEIKLVEPLQEDRGWCLDLRGGQNNAVTVGGVQAHTCYTYQENGVSRDQGYIKESILEDNEFKMFTFTDMCLTIYEPFAGSFVSVEPCDGRLTQKIELTENGKVIPEINTDLCLTVGKAIMPGGGGNPLHILRKASFEDCGAHPDEFQTWELRAEWAGLDEATLPRTYQNAARQQGGGQQRPGGQGAAQRRN